jgi:hypothetical protein
MDEMVDGALRFNGSGAASPPITETKCYETGKEVLSMNEEIGDVEHTAFSAFPLSHANVGSALRVRELTGLVNAVVAYLQRHNYVTLPRRSCNTKRSFALLATYIQAHYQLLAPVIAKIQLGDKDKKQIPLLDAGRHMGNDDE